MSSFDQNPERQGVVQASRDAGYADDSLLPHLSPLGWEHINLTGDYNWRQSKQVKQGDFRAPTAAQAALVHEFFRFVGAELKAQIIVYLVPPKQ